jgi:hypothetical protein
MTIETHMVDMSRFPVRGKLSLNQSESAPLPDEELLNDAALIHRASVIVGYAAAIAAAIMLLILIAVLILVPIPAKAENPGKITIAQAAAMATALRNMDGHIIVVKQGGIDNMVMIPWDFGSASLRLRIASDIAILDGVARSVETSRQAIIKELLAKANERTPDKPATEIKPSTPEYDEFQRQYADLNASPAPGTQDLARIKASELHMDRNDIPVTVLSALGPILDDDVSAK